MAVLAIAAVGAVAGAAVGASFGAVALGASIGWAVGSFIGQLAFGPDPPSTIGPRLQDLAVQSSAEGVGIPIVFGRARIAGNVIWGRPIQETRHEEDVGKGMGGGGTQVSYTYSVSFAIGICEGTIIGVRKIWADSKLIYDVSASADAGTLQVSQELAKSIRVYTGSETQTADPTIQSFEGAANTPAYRGLAYLVFEDLQLADFANHMPNVTCEVLSSGSVTGLRMLVNNTATGFNFTSNQWPDDARVELGIVRASQPKSVSRNTSSVVPGDGYHFLYDFAGNTIGRENFVYPLMVTPPWSNSLVFLYGYLGSESVYFVHHQDAGLIGLAVGGNWLVPRAYGVFSASDPIGAVILHALCVSQSAERLFVWLREKTGEPDTFGYRLRVYAPGLQLMHDGVATTVPQGSLPDEARNVAVESNSRYLWVYEGTLKLYSIGTDYSLTLSETISPGGSSTYSWFAAENGIAAWWAVDDLRIFSRIPVYTPTTVTLASVVSALSLRTGLVAGDLDTAALTDTVDGYVIPRPMTARAAMEQLRQAYFFDGVESDGKVKFVKRAGASAATIASDDLGVHEYGQEPKEPIRITRAQELELPVEIHVQYLDLDNDYLPGSQEARRLTTQSKNQIRVDLPIALSSAKAAQIADVLMRNAWVERHRFGFALTRKYAQLDPSDNITVPTAQGLALARLTRTDYGASGVLQCEALADDTVLYSSSVVGNDASVNEPQVLSPAGPTQAHYLDTPMLRDADDDPGFYVAAAGYLGGWKGAAIYKSVDGGATWDPALALFSGAVLGYATGVLGDFSGGNVWDKGNRITVKINTPGGALSSTTELAVYAGANAAAIGVHGRWEIVQFQTATLEGDGTYTLSNLLRGRRGSEWAQAGHVSGDLFVLLTTATLRHVEAASAEIGLQRHYRAVSLGNSLESAEIKPFTNTAVGLECYSPVFLTGARDGSSDTLVTWERRTRIGGEWRDYVEAALGEAAENYEVEIWNSAFSVLRRTITALTAKTATYTLAQETADFGAIQSAIGARIYQLSATVGRGQKAEAVIALAAVLATTWNPLDKSGNITLSLSDLKATAAATNWKTVRANSSRSTGKWYFEVRIDTEGASSVRYHMVGICQAATGLENHLAFTTGRGYYGNDGNFWNGSSTGAPAVTYTAGDVIGIAFDADADKMWFAKNNTWLASGDPGAGTNPAFTGLTGTWFPAYSPFQQDNAATARFKSADFTYSPPSGFAAWGI